MGFNFNPFKKREVPPDVVRPSEGPPTDVFYSVENAGNLRQQIEGQELLLDKVPVGATIELRTDNTVYELEKVDEKIFLVSSDPKKEWIENGVTKVAIHGALPGGGAIIEPGIIRTGAGLRYIRLDSADNETSIATLSPVRFAKIHFKGQSESK